MVLKFCLWPMNVSELVWVRSNETEQLLCLLYAGLMAQKLISPLSLLHRPRGLFVSNGRVHVILWVKWCEKRLFLWGWESCFKLCLYYLCVTSSVLHDHHHVFCVILQRRLLNFVWFKIQDSFNHIWKLWMCSDVWNGTVSCLLQTLIVKWLKSHTELCRVADLLMLL